MSNAELERAIEAAWDVRDTITPATTGESREAIERTLNALDGGSLRVAEPKLAVHKGLAGGTRSTASLWVGAKISGAPPGFARYPIVSSANRRLSRQVWY